MQNYAPDKSVTNHYVAKTTDGGQTWQEILLTHDKEAQEFGVGFLDEKIGWVGTYRRGYETTDGGKTWTPKNLGAAVNKIRLMKTDEGFVGYAIGVGVHKLVVSATTTK